MKILKNIILVVLLLSAASCVSTVKFPVSNVAPAAAIKASIGHDRNDNTLIEVNAKHLASPDRLNPPKKLYILWATTAKNDIKNLGQMLVNNESKVSIKTRTPFIVKDLFITAEDQGNLSYPEGVEISRGSVNQSK